MTVLVQQQTIIKKASENSVKKLMLHRFLKKNGGSLYISEPKKTILIVDDDSSILRVFTRVLERKGYAVASAATGKDGLNLVRICRFDAALIDVRLPDFDGTELLPIIQETSPETLKIVFTGYPDIESLNDGGKKYIDAFLIKPVSPEVILNILDEKLKPKID